VFGVLLVVCEQRRHERRTLARCALVNKALKLVGRRRQTPDVEIDAARE
jgi:hypothetical protein